MLLLALVAACSRESGSGKPASSLPQPYVTPASDLQLTIDADLVLLVHAAWEADPAATDEWVEYRFEGDDWLVAPATEPGQAAILGIPEQTDVEARLASVVDGQTRYSATSSATTGALPDGLPLPTTSSYDPSLASPAQWAMITVAAGFFTYQGPYWIEIFDRAGRIVWYHEVPDELFSFYPSVARDGTHIWFEGENIFGLAYGDARITRQTLDGRWSVVLPVTNLGQAVAEGPDGAFFYEQRNLLIHALGRLDPDGTTTTVWDCEAAFGDLGLDQRLCVMNTCNWDETRNTVLVSQFETSTVFEIDLATGQPIRQMGELAVGDPYAFDPPDANFAYQHDPAWTAEGTLLVSTHVPCGADPGCYELTGQDGTQLAAEYQVDDATKTLTRIWTYQSTDLWATQAGEAYRLPNGNIVQGYGQDGAAREVTPDGQVAWQVDWSKDYAGYRVVGHLSLIEDLYALNRGP